ncbi:aldo/keto reductase [Paractinoplanes lichenicola]|uniref:Aldo/keto reductase n=1 Tax=Paractinoplanes lichenicola TaxID=2802976 RepID=A0ABS1W5S4_9ACTN|nr:aldo/keto reductase [Actinoplanes lichenicola]MBL7262086.1 aldo/keto reductase [Actinoplanes lichenicola]
MSTLGSSGIEVFPLNLGGNVFGWTSDEATSHRVLDAFVEAGGNFVDTADGYSAWVPGNSGGESETIIGSWFAARGHRDRVVLATKVSTHPQFQGLAAANVAAAADASLSRLRTDYIDLYYAHYDDANTPLEETAGAFDALVKAGKVRAIGVSNYSAARIREWFEIARRNGFALPVAVQPHYNLVERTAYERDIAPVAEAEGLAVLPYYALAAGFLTGKYRTEADLASGPRGGGAKQYLTEDGLAVVKVLTDIAATHGVEPATVALAWLRTRKNVAAPIASARSTEQLPALIASATLNLAADELAALDEVSAR